MKATEALSKDGVQPGGQDGVSASAPKAKRAPKYILEHIRLELFGAKLDKAAQMQNLNEDETAYFGEKFYYNIRDRELKQEKGQKTRGNPSGLLSFFKKKKYSGSCLM